ncbi:MAG: restriction endonuclease subunit S [Acidobacteriia bacterium]|nr:restriction endonuclease subunit S [Terriglobia bacterium]
MIGSREEGIPLYASGELLNYTPETDTYLARRHADSVRDLLAEPGILLFTRSGSVGRVLLTPPFLAGAAIQDDVLKVVPETRKLAYYLYIYFLSPIGQPLLSDTAFGSVIQHIKVDHIRELPVLRLGAVMEEAIANRVEKAIAARLEAHQMLKEVDYACLSYNRLPNISENTIEWLAGDERRAAFSVPTRDIISPHSESTELRLEAHFHNPIVRCVIANIQKCPSKKRTLALLAHDVILGGRFKRNYVGPAFGTPFLSGKNIVQVRPADLKYLSNTQNEGLDDLLVKKDWILVTRSGTIGRTCYVWHNFENYAASEHILRIIPRETETDPAYLYAFLSSRYGYEQIIRFRHGSVIDEITDEQLKKVIVPLPEPRRQKEIGEKVRLAYEKRAEALRLEDEAQEMLIREIEGKAAKEA